MSFSPFILFTVNNDFSSLPIILSLNWKIILLTHRYLLQSIFERFDKDRSGKIDSNELRDALLSLGYAVSPVVLDLLVSKFDKTGGKSKAIEYDNFIEYGISINLVFLFWIQIYLYYENQNLAHLK